MVFYVCQFCALVSFFRYRFLGLDAFVRNLERIIVLWPWCSFICPSGTGVHFDHTVHVSADLSLWLESPMFWTLWRQSISTYSYPSLFSSIWNRGGVWMYKLGVISRERLKIQVKLLLSANRQSYISGRLAQQWMTLNDLEWPFNE